MKLPNGESAFVDLAKLRDYSLSATHPEGKHKARVFLAALGIDASHAEWLRNVLLAAAREADCDPGQVSAFGARYSIEIIARREGRTARICSAWIIRSGEQIPRLVSCYVI